MISRSLFPLRRYFRSRFPPSLPAVDPDQKSRSLILLKMPSSSNLSNIPAHERRKTQPAATPQSNNFASEAWLSENSDKSYSSVSQKRWADKQVQTSFSSGQSLPGTGSMRWVICFCDCVINVGKYYCMDTPQALQTYFLKGELRLSSLEYNLFFCISSFFFVFALFSRPIIERYGIRLTVFILCFLCFLGQFLFTIGGTLEKYGIMLLGRFFFGIGSFWLEVCQDVMISEWFFNKELALALGMRFSTCRLGTALTIYITPKVMLGGGYLEALVIGLILSFLGILSSMLIAFVDRNYESEKGPLQPFESFLKDFSSIERGLSSLECLRSMGPLFWQMVLNVMFVYACYLGFVNNSIDIICSLYGFNPQKAGELMTLMYLSASATPFFGMAIDKIGRRVNIMLILLMLVSFPFWSFCLLPIEISKEIVLLLLIFLGLFFPSYVATIWSAFPLLVEGNRQCFAYTIIYSFLNISMILGAFFVGMSLDWLGKGDDPHQYEWAFFCMVGCLLVCLFLVLRIKYQGDKKTIYALNSFITNQEIRDIINEDPNLGQILLEMMENEDEGDVHNRTPSFINLREKNDEK